MGGMRCSVCGQENPDGFRFCGNCAAPLVLEQQRDVRKTVTVVFCDLTGSTALGDVTDPETLRATMRGYYDEMRTILERHGGKVEKFIGDAVMAVFGVPVSYEDDAIRAVRAAWEMHDAVPTLGLQARIGVNTGGVVTGEGDTFVTGDAVNVAARLEQAATPGDVLIGAETRQLVRDAVRVEPVNIEAKGKGQVEAFRLVDVDLQAAPIARRLDTPLIGRRSELEQLKQAFERSMREHRCHLFTILGAAGVGKSRLVGEFLGATDARIVTGACLDYGEGITFWPVISVLKSLGPRADPTIAQIVEGAATANELFYAVRAQLEDVASEQPLVVFFDDIQWGEPTFLDLVDHIADLSRGVPIFVLCLARPDLLDKRPGWGGGKLNATTILLQPLSVEECVELIKVHGGVETDMEERILAAADGNPLFVEEMVALVREDGDVRIPSTVQALLQARLDQLGREERAVIERGAVEGQIFHRGAVLELTQAADVEPQLTGLVRKELIHPTRATLAGDHAFRFRHLLIRDAAYDALPKETRANLHERFAGWLERNGHELIELDEMLGYHFEQAARYRRELGRPDVDLELRAAERLGEAGSKAGVRSDIHAAANLLERAINLLPVDHERRAPLLIELIGTLEGSAAAEEQSARIDELEASANPTVQMHGRIARLQLRLLTNPENVVAEAEDIGEQALALFGTVGDDLGLAHTYYLLAWVSWLQSLARPTQVALENLLRYARKANSRALIGRVMVQQIGLLYYGPFTTDEIRERLAELEADDSMLGRAVATSVKADLAQREGQFEESIALLDEVMQLHAELGSELGQLITGQRRAEALADAGQLDAAVSAFRETIEELIRLGMTSFRSTTTINFAEILYLIGEVEEADRLAIEGEELGAAEDVVNFAWGRGLRARIAADRGDHSEAETLGRDALENAYKTDFPSVRASAHEALAHVFASSGRSAEARTELERALEIWSHYGFRIQTDRTRASLVEL
jgi:class 3 adenylate cyclase/tetratricopeptide (TPR) repeat protein